MDFVMSHIVFLEETIEEKKSGLVIGPMPKQKCEIEYLKNIGTECFVNLLPINNEQRTKTGVLKSEAYREYLKDDIYIRKLHVPIDMESLSCVTGKTVDEKKTKQAKLYILFAENLIKSMKETGSKRFYIHCKTGFQEEVLVGFMLWKLMFPESAPANPCTWITEKEYTLLLNDAPDLKLLLLEIWNEIDKKRNGISKFFQNKKSK